MLLLSSIDVRLIPVYTGSSYYQYLCKHYVLSCRQKSTTKRVQCKLAWKLPSVSALLKEPKNSAHGRFLYGKRSWWFSGLRNSFDRLRCYTPCPSELKQSFASHKFGCSRQSVNKFTLCSRLHKLSSFSSNHWRRLPKSLMRTEKAMNISMNITGEF